MIETLLLNETPIDYYDGTDRGVVGVKVSDGEDCADLGVSDGAATINLRLDRTELAQLIAVAARAMALLS